MLVQTVLKVVLVDINPAVVRAWRSAFSDLPEVHIVQGSLLEQKVDAWVTPTNAQGNMDGGVDAAIKRRLGPRIEKRVQEEIRRVYGDFLPIGCATCIPTGIDLPRYLISTPTMVRSSEDISATLNVALACAAAFQMIHIHNSQGLPAITSVALPGLGASTGGVPVRVCANLMWTAYTLFRDHAFRDFATMQTALHEQLGAMSDGSEERRVRIRVPVAGQPM